MRILIATDAWRPQVNGVVRSLETMARAAEELGAEIDFLTPRDFNRVPMPTYPEIELAIATPRAVARRLDEGFDHVHIATEGPVGLVTRARCMKIGRRFTTSYHTRFPEYIQARTGLPVGVAYAALRRFHNASAGTMVSTLSLARDLQGWGFRRLQRWSRGVDHKIFNPEAARPHAFPRPVFLCAGRVAVEKNLEAFLSLDLPGTKLVVGDGPARKKLQEQFPKAHFLGVKDSAELAALYASADVFVFPSRTDTFGNVLLEAMACGLPVAAFPVPGTKLVVGDGPARKKLQEQFPEAHFLGVKDSAELAALYASADVFVFPSRTDTFGNVLLEAMACGLPVAAFPVPGPLDVVGDSGAGVLNEDLRAAALAALDIPRAVPLAYSRNFTWEACAQQFLDNVGIARAAATPLTFSSPTQFVSAEKSKLVLERELIQP